MAFQKTIPLISTLSAVLLVGCGGGPAPVSFQSDVKPLIDKYCRECHIPGSEGAEASGFVVDSYETVMKGTKYGPVIVAADPLSSSFYRLVAGKVDPSIQMPHGKEPLTPQEIATIERWIEQGAKNN